MMIDNTDDFYPSHHYYPVSILTKQQYDEITKNSTKFKGHISECCIHNIGTNYACKSSIHVDQWDDAIKWCLDNIHSDEYLIYRQFHDEGMDIEFSFEKEEIAMAFKLRWL